MKIAHKTVIKIMREIVVAMTKPKRVQLVRKTSMTASKKSLRKKARKEEAADIERFSK